MLNRMGNREDLIAGAKRCLLEKGYAATTARDIASASGVSLAAIGYHFGSKDALMNQAVYDSVGDWADEMQRIMPDLEPDTDPVRQLELAAAQLVLMSLVDHNDELRSCLANVQSFAGQGLAEFFLGIDPETEPEAARLA